MAFISRSISRLSKVVVKCLSFSQSKYEEIREDDSVSSARLLPYTSNLVFASTMLNKRVRTYGTTRSSRSATVATSIFGKEESPLPLPVPAARERVLRKDVAATAPEVVVEMESSISVSEPVVVPKKKQSLDPLPIPIPDLFAEIESALGGLSLGVEDKQEDEEQQSELVTLLDAYKADRGTTLPTSSWSSIIPEPSQITKIAEASYAEVYRVTTKQGNSIIKIMQLCVGSDPDSFNIDTAIDISTVVSEFRIMNALTEVPGFVTFKEAHLIQGQLHQKIKDAHLAHLPKLKDGSDFPDPESYTDKSMFLVIELGDAGTVLEDLKITKLDHVWDIFLGTVIALCRAEMSNEFEHRDLHENNICVAKKTARATKYHELLELYRGPGQKFGFSGLEVALIDYGLSRAKLANGDVAFNNLEVDLGLFHGKETGPNKMQFDIYRRMRTHLFTGTHTLQPKAWHNEKSRSLNNGHKWDEYTPYSNVLWLNYILNYLVKAYKRDRKVDNDLEPFLAETKELSRRLNVRTKAKKGGFQTAQEVLEFCMESQWVLTSQVENYGVDTEGVSVRSWFSASFSEIEVGC